MQTRVTCLICVQKWIEEGIDQLELARRSSRHWATVTKQGPFEWTCPEGHAARFVFQTPFYVLLFHKGETDLARQDTRSATLNFYSAWDSFVAFACEVLLNEAGIHDKIPSRVKSSESLLGMFVGLVAARTGKYPKLVGRGIGQIRNEVIHGDRIPTAGDALKVGLAIQEAILTTRQQVAEFDAIEMRASAARLSNVSVDAGPGAQVGVTTIWVRPDFNRDLATRVAAIRKELDDEQRSQGA